MAIGYRSILRLDEREDAIRIANEEAASWVRSKVRGSGFDGFETQGVYKIGRNVTVTKTLVADERDGSSRQLIRLNEVNPTGRWVVSILAASCPNSKRGPQSLVIEVDRPDSDAETALSEAKPPRLVRQLLDRTVVRDGDTVLTANPVLVHDDEISEVLDAILDSRRAISVVVASSPGGVADVLWRDAVGSLVADSRGVSTAFVVADSAVEEFNDRLPDGYGVPRGGIRTFAPHVTFEDRADAVRHRYLGPKAFLRSFDGKKVGGALPRVHAERARRRFIESELPRDIRRAFEVLTRAEAAIEREARVQARAEEAARIAVAVPALPGLAPQPTATDESARILSQIEGALGALFARWLGSSDLGVTQVFALEKLLVESRELVTVADEQIAELQTERDARSEEIERLREEREQAELSARYDSDAAIAAEREARILRQRLIQFGKYEETYVEDETEHWVSPQSFDEFVLYLNPEVSDRPIANRVVFTGDPSAAIEIDKRDPVGRYVSKMWEYACVLYDYAESGYEGSVHQYLNDANVTLRKCSPQRHAASESETVATNPKMRGERTFPVPVEVSKAGEIVMLAHFKPTQADTFAPRMYYHDDTRGTGKIYVGYMGQHLTNTRTRSA
jgi:hypothetical protein